MHKTKAAISRRLKYPVLNKDMNINRVGIKNVNERLKLNYGDGYGLRIISEEGKGTEVILVMPATTERKRLR